MKYIPITIAKDIYKVDFYTISNFANETLGKFAGGNVPYFYFKLYLGRKSSREFDAGFAKLDKIRQNKLVVFLSEEDVLIAIDSYVHVWDFKWDVKKTENSTLFVAFLKEKVKFLNWFKDVFPKLDCTL